MSPARLKAAIAGTTGLLMFGLITHGHYASSGDAVHYLAVAHSVAFDGDLDVANDYADPGRLFNAAPENHARPGRNGVLRPVHDVGLPVLAAPVVGLAYRMVPLVRQLPESIRRKTKLSDPVALRQMISMFMIAITALLAVRFFSASWRLTGMKAAAFGFSLVWALSPPILTHGYIFMTEIPTALLALTIYLRLDGVKGAPGTRGLEARGVILGLLVGLLLLIHVRNIGLVLAFAFLAWWRLTRTPAVRNAFLSGLAVMFAIKIGLNWWFWGTWLTTPHEHFAGWPGFGPFVMESMTRTFGLLFDPRHGLLFSAPIYLLAPASMVLLARKSRGAAIELCLIVACYLFFVLNPVTNIHGWRGGWSPAARFLVPIVPFVAFGLPLLVASRAGRLATAVAVLLQAIVSGTHWTYPMFTFSEGPGPAPWIAHLAGRSVAESLPAWTAVTPALTAVALVAFGFWWLLTRWLVRAGLVEAWNDR